MKQTLQALASLVDATVQGDHGGEIRGVSSLEKAKSGELAFLTSGVYRDLLKTTKASAVVLNKKEAVVCDKTRCFTILIVDDPRYAMAKILALFFKEEPFSNKMRIHQSAVIEPSAVIAKTAVIGPNCYIGEHCRIGEGSRLSPNVVLCANVSIGQNCRIKSGAVIGSQGFCL